MRAGRSETAFFGADARFVELGGLDRAEARRLGRYNSMVRQLHDGRISKAQFRSRARALRPIRAERLASDPDAVLARIDELRALDIEPFRYQSGRAA